jgi:hypothetical protein
VFSSLHLSVEDAHNLHFLGSFGTQVSVSKVPSLGVRLGNVEGDGAGQSSGVPWRAPPPHRLHRQAKPRRCRSRWIHPCPWGPRTRILCTRAAGTIHRTSQAHLLPPVPSLSTETAPWKLHGHGGVVNTSSSNRSWLPLTVMGPSISS